MEVYSVRNVRTLIFLILVAALVWGCIEDLEPKSNRKPMVWFIRGPENGSVTFDNAVSFEWNATDWDDDLGMGATYIRLEPATVEWYDATADSYVVFSHREGWVRVYDEIYDIIDLPDSTFRFSVRVEDDRGADSTISRLFYVRFDPDPPIIDNIDAPPPRPTNPQFTHTYRIYAHDEARSPRAATPTDSLEFNWRFVGPSGVDPMEPSITWSIYNRTVQISVDGQTYPGEYRFRCKVRDRAGNVSEEAVAKFEIVN
jgi:hypothetical protein